MWVHRGNVMTVDVIGAGLAGCECALQLAKFGIKVRLIEMKPHKMSAAHSNKNFAELVCSNSLKSNDIYSASGLLKQELRSFDSILIGVADEVAVPAGGALAVDRTEFSKRITEKIQNNDNIEVISKTENKISSNNICVVATGPLTDEALLDEIKILCGNEFLYFFDAASPIVTFDSIDKENSFISSRYGKGTDDYINCPLDEKQFELFWNELINAKVAEIKDFEKKFVFESCIPIEIMANRGKDTIRFGPMKPVGLTEPKTLKRPYAVLQLRKENTEGTLYNLVGFQTHLTFSEQKRVFSLIPALKNAEFVRYGVMHKNTFINAPKLLNESFNLKTNSKIYFAGQISGVEGYVESIMSGLMVALDIVSKIYKYTPIGFSKKTLMGALSSYISNSSSSDFQPMNANFGILEPLDKNEKNKELKKQLLAERALREAEISANILKGRKYVRK